MNDVRSNPVFYPLFFIAGVVTLLFLFSVYRYGAFAGYLDHSEAAIAFRAWLSIGGGDLYPSPASETYLLTAYGPLAFFVNGGVTALFGPSITASKGAALGSAVLSLAFMAGFIYRTFGWPYLGPGILVFACYLLFAAPYTLWARPDPLMIFLVSIALFATTVDGAGARRWTAPVVIAVCVGLSVNLKIHSFIFFVPIVWHYCARRRLRVWPVMIAVAVAVILLPFTLPQVSPWHYVDGIRELAQAREIQFEKIPHSLRFAVVYLSPGVVLGLAYVARAGKVPAADMGYFAVLVGCVGVAFFSTLLAGTYWYHLVPFLAGTYWFPVSLDLILRFARTVEDRRTAFAAIMAFVAVVFVILTVTPQKRLHRVMTDRGDRAREVAGEVTSILQRHRGETVQMGYGEDVAETYRLSYFKPLLAHAGNIMTVDGHADMEAGFAGISENAARIAHLTNCRTDLWLIPKDEAPFALKSYYPRPPAGAKTGHFLYSDDFRKAFLSAHKKIDAHTFFDVWACGDR